MHSVTIQSHVSSFRLIDKQLLLNVFGATWLELILLLPFVLFKVLDFVLELIHDLVLQLNTQITVFVANLLL